MTRGPLQDIVFGGIDDERERGQAIGDDIDPQQVERQKRQGQATECRHEHHREFGPVRAPLVMELIKRQHRAMLGRLHGIQARGLGDLKVIHVMLFNRTLGGLFGSPLLPPRRVRGKAGSI